MNNEDHQMLNNVDHPMPNMLHHIVDQYMTILHRYNDIDYNHVELFHWYHMYVLHIDMDKNLQQYKFSTEENKICLIEFLDFKWLTSWLRTCPVGQVQPS